VAQQLSGTKTHDTNLKGPPLPASRRPIALPRFAKVADVEGHADVAVLFRDTRRGRHRPYSAPGTYDYPSSSGWRIRRLDKPIGSTDRPSRPAVACQPIRFTKHETVTQVRQRASRGRAFERIAGGFRRWRAAETSQLSVASRQGPRQPQASTRRRIDEVPGAFPRL